ncbi:MAG: DUF4180 domain-containing protein [Pseudomonadota bacterium]|nr:DUF4180 domain-containing protein [Pseudomonadota bacterium]
MIETQADIMDLIGTAAFDGPTRILRDKADFAPAFWDQRTGLLGELAQKLTNYGLTLHLTGDFSAETDASRALHDYFVEAQRTGPITLETPIR